ncbi:MAG: arylsulfatase [Saprospiraceae bacterium]|nr:arylsulfatase [Saprospiraceae bacterium]
MLQLNTYEISGKAFLFALVCGGIISLNSCGDVPAEASWASKAPNIILIITDDQGYGDLGRHGNEIIQTPNLDRLHDQSVRFTNFHVGTTCAPTRAGLMSGMNCNRVGAWHTILGRSFLSARFPALPSALKESGYTTGIFGKWHLGDNYPFRPQDRGFDEVLIHGGGGVGQTPDYWNNDYFDDTYFRNGVPEKQEGYCTDVWFDEAIKFIEAKTEMDQPFFCYLSTNAPHGPFHVPQQFIDLYKDNSEVPNPNFYGMITNIDENIGKLEKTLERLDLNKSTILIFLTDNGTAAGADLNAEGQVEKGFNARMRGKKGSEYEGGHRVPLFMRFPEAMQIAVRSYNDLVSYNDIFPTIRDLVGMPQDPQSNFDGTSFITLLKTGAQENLKNRILITDTQREEWPVKYKNACVMRDQWRLINNRELYYLTDDPAQQHNVIDQNKQLADTLSQAYEDWWSDIEPDFHFANRIIVGKEQESVTLLTSHDWHSSQTSPWNQGQIRQAKIDNGAWLLQVHRPGTYFIRLHRWPPYLDEGYADSVPEGEEVSGGMPAVEGKGISITNAKISIGDQMMENNKSIEGKYFEFKVDLDAGPADLQTWITTSDNVERGAYYVELASS